MKISKLALMVSSLISVTALSSCGFKQAEVKDDPNEKVDLVMWVPTAGGLEPGDMDKVLALANKRLETVLPNTTINIKYEDTNGFGAVMTRMFGASEAFDICFSSYGTNDYFDNASKNNFFGFTEEQMETYCPDIYKYYDASLWDLMKIDGKYYGTINNQTRARQGGVSLDKLYLRKYLAEELQKGSYTEVTDKDISDWVNTVENFDDLEDYLAYAKVLNDNGPHYRFITGMMDMSNMMYYMNFDDFGRYNVPGVLPIGATSADQIVNQFETTEFKDLIAHFKTWYGKYVDSSVLSGGITSSTYPTLSMRCLGTYKPGVEQEEYTICSKDMVCVPLGSSLMTSTSCLTTMSSISYTSKHPARALKFLNTLFTDKELYNTLIFGREDTDYVVKERDLDGTPTQIEVFSSAKYKTNNPWAYGNQYLAYPTIKQPSDVWKQTQQFTDTAKKSLAYGFIFNEEPVSSEIASCINVYSTYFMQLINNTDPYVDSGKSADKQFYDDFIKQMKTAGSDKIIAEMKSQLSAWLAKK